MPSIVSAIIRAGLQAIYSNGGSAKQNVSRTPLCQFTDGNGASQANRLYDTDAADLSLAASATQTYNLTSLVDSLGNTIVATKIKGLVIEHRANSAAVSGVTIGGGSNPVFGTQLTGLPLLPGDHIQICFKSGYTVTAVTGMNLGIVNADSSHIATVRVTLLLSQ